MNMKSLLLASFCAATCAAVTVRAEPAQAAPTDARGAPAEAGFVPFEFASPYGYSPFTRDAREYFGQAPLDWPAAEVREFMYARARTILARWEMIYAGDRINEQVDRYKRQYERSDAFQEAKVAEDEAWQNLQQATASVSARLMDDPQYATNVALAADLRTRIDDRAYEDPSLLAGKYVASSQFDLALARLGYARRASALRAEAMAGDPTVVEARARLQLAAAKRASLQKEFENKLKDDPRLLQLRLDQEKAQAFHSAAAAYEQSARFTRKQAWKYARFLHRNDSYPYYGSPYAGGGYLRPYDIDYGIRPVAGTYGFKRRE